MLAITPWYPDHSDPMLGLFVKNHLLAISLHADVTVLFITSRQNNGQKKTVINYDYENSLYTYRVYYPAKQTGPVFIKNLCNAYRYLNACTKAWKLIRSERGMPDIVHVNILTRSGILALWLKLTRNIKYIITEHWSRYLVSNFKYHGFLRKLITRIVVANASAVTVVSKQLKDAMSALKLRNEYHIVPNVVDVELFRPFEAVPQQKKQFVSITCFEDKSKNLSGLLDAVDDLSKERDDFILEFVGTGNDFQPIKSRADILGLTGKFVFFKGLLENEELSKCIGQASASVLFSNYETFGIVLFESMACGVPVISTKTGILPEIFEGFMGYLIDIQDKEQLKQAMRNILDDILSTDKNKLREFVVNNFNYEKVGQAFLNLYRQTLGR